MIDTSLFRFNNPIQMRWSDCDMLQHVNNAVYLTYAEQARTEYCNHLDWDWEEHGIILAKTEVNFIKPLLYHDQPVIYTRVTRLGNKSFETETLILDEKGETPELIAKIFSILVMFHYKTHHTFPIPEAVREKIRAFEGKDL